MLVRSSFRLFVLSAVLACANAAAAFALEQKAFDAGAFKAAQDAGKPVIVHVTAPWCSTCKAQHAAIDGIAKNPAFEAVTVFQIDFDSQADVWKSFSARSQSTLIAYAGEEETGRIVGQTAAQPIEALVQSTLVK